ncbi:MAG: class III lanthipeptide [Lactobacillus sp.]|nr:class III lanthipeptide [Lactobacillus sp.]
MKKVLKLQHIATDTSVTLRKASSLSVNCKVLSTISLAIC